MINPYKVTEVTVRFYDGRTVTFPHEVPYSRRPYKLMREDLLAHFHSKDDNVIGLTFRMVELLP